MGLGEQQVPDVSWNATSEEAAWFVFQHMGDGEFESQGKFWAAYGDAQEYIHNIGVTLPFQHKRSDSLRCAVREGWLVRRPDGSMTLKLKTPSWELEKELSEPAATPPTSEMM